MKWRFCYLWLVGWKQWFIRMCFMRYPSFAHKLNSNIWIETCDVSSLSKRERDKTAWYYSLWNMIYSLKIIFFTKLITNPKDSGLLKNHHGLEPQKPPPAPPLLCVISIQMNWPVLRCALLSVRAPRSSKTGRLCFYSAVHKSIDTSGVASRGIFMCLCAVWKLNNSAFILHDSYSMVYSRPHEHTAQVTARGILGLISFIL